MVTVTLIDHCRMHPMAKARFAANLCYQPEIPKLSDVSDEGTRKFVREKLFSVSHHTTMEHQLFPFAIEGIPVGVVTFGLHLTSPFYNSDQRSGRFCADMFNKPDYRKIFECIRLFWPLLDEDAVDSIMSYVRDGLTLYQSYLPHAIVKAEELLRRERPNATPALLGSAKKIAQEQLRNLVPVIFPTALLFSVDLISLVALWESSWSPVMRHVTDRMRDEILAGYPELSDCFDSRRRCAEWSPLFEEGEAEFSCEDGPKITLGYVSDPNRFVSPSPEDLHHVDRLHFRPEYMNNSVGSISTTVTLSVATMGQDQRHRTISRGEPVFRKLFYLPPILSELSLADIAKRYMERWWTIVSDGKIPKSLATLLAPYGAMVTYDKRGSFNAVAHEQSKRLCWCPQQEIYESSRKLRMKIRERYGDISLLRIFEPPCYRTGKCVEGARYCGRDISKRESGDYFPKRQV